MGTFTKNNACIKSILGWVWPVIQAISGWKNACVYLNATRSRLEIEEKLDSRWIVSPSAAYDKSSRTFVTWEHRVCRPSWINSGSDTSSTARSTTLPWWEGGWMECKWREEDRDYRPWTIDNENKMCYSLNPCNHKGSLNYTISDYHFSIVLPLCLLCIHCDFC